MDRVIVTSSNVKSVGYDSDTSTLEVEFHSADEPRVYRYTPVESEDFDAIVDPANSAGRIMNGIKYEVKIGRIKCERVDVADVDLPNTHVASTEVF